MTSTLARPVLWPAGWEQRRVGGGAEARSYNVESGSFLAIAPDDVSEEIAALGSRQTFRRGATLVRQGELLRWVSILLSGRAKLTYHSDSGFDVLFDIVGPGELLGGLCAIDGLPAEAAINTVDEGEVLVTETQVFQEYLRAHAEAANLVTRTLARRVRKTTQDRAALTINNALGCVCFRLLELAERYGERTEGGVRITLRLSQVELGAWAGTSREATAKALHTLRRRECIATGRREIRILNVPELRQWVVGGWAA